MTTQTLWSAIAAVLLLLFSPVAQASDWINLNTATPEQLDTLPGVGPSKAQAIIDHRDSHGPFDTVEQLDDVKGFGPATVNKLRPYLSVDNTPPTAVAPQAHASHSGGVETASTYSGGAIDLNTATAAELETIPGVGPSRALAIIDRRESVGPFTATSQIMEIKGVGPKTFEKMKPHLTVD